MKLLIQRVQNASVSVDGDIIGQINKGFLVFVGVGQGDNQVIADKMIDKMLHLRIFEDENGKTNLDLQAVNGELLIISQFTLYANCKKGNRPSFVDAMDPGAANELYEYTICKCIENGYKVATGSFGADMEVSLVNDGPFTVMLDSDVICAI